jgi:hypothetical protein
MSIGHTVIRFNSAPAAGAATGVTGFPRPLRRAARVVAPQATNTTDTELSGINTAHHKGDNHPAAATLMPTAL